MNLKERTEAAERFLVELGRGIPDTERVMVGYASEATVQTDASGKKKNSGWWPEPWKFGKYIRDTRNCYVCISSSIKTPNEKGEMRYWRGEASFGHGLALMVDDIGSGTGSKGGLSVETMALRLPPTAVVETSPGNYQLWYFFDAPCDNMPLFKRFLVSFVKYVLLKRGGDTTIQDVSRYGRMPIGINNKRLEDGSFKYGKYGCDVHIHGTPDYTARYSMREICKAFNFEIDPPPPPREIPDGATFDAYWLKIIVDILSKLRMGEQSGGRVSANMSGKYRIRCPWGDEHTNGDPGGGYFRGPIAGADYDYVFGCAHDSCRKSKRTWAAFTDHFAIPEIVRHLKKANADAPVNFGDFDVNSYK